MRWPCLCCQNADGCKAAASSRRRWWSGAAQRQVAQPDEPETAATAGEKAPQPAAKRRQPRKQAQPQHLPPPPPPSQQQQQQQEEGEEREPSLAPTVLVVGAEDPCGSKGPAAASLGGMSLAAGEAAAAAAAGTAHCNPEPEQPLPPAQQGTAPNLFDLLQQAIGIAAAAASGLTSELVAAFAMLLPLPDQKVNLTCMMSTLRCLTRKPMLQVLPLPSVATR